MELVELISVWEGNFGFDAVGETKEKYFGFLRRQLTKHREYDLNFRKVNGRGNGLTRFPWADYLIDRLLLFSYIIGDTPIVVDFDGRVRRIGYGDGVLKPVELRTEDLRLLSGKNIGVNKQYEEYRTDMRLFRLYNRTSLRRYKKTFREKWQGWGQAIDEIGRDKDVVRFFGREVSYEGDVCWSTNGYCSSQGKV